MARTWIVQKAREDELANTLNTLEKEGAFELHGIYSTGDVDTGPGGFSDKRAAYLVVGTRTDKKKAQFA